jgi:hypothetical protein
MCWLARSKYEGHEVAAIWPTELDFSLSLANYSLTKLISQNKALGGRNSGSDSGSGSGRG